jgi:5'-3' exonuclease
VIVRIWPDHILEPVSQPLLAIDGPAVLYRAFFALPDSIKDPDGRPVNALLGSVNQALWCVEKYDPRAVVWCFGAEAGEYRVEAFPAYHADRPPMPDPLEWQWERAPALYESLGWSLAATEDLEADDLLHSLSEVETAAGGRTLILTGDRDMFQCASDSVTVLMQRTGGDGPEEVGPDGVRERYGIEPEQVPDFIALRGDPSDGLPGAKGIGPKTAAELLRRKGDLEHVILGAIREKPAVRRALIEQADELRAFKDIATLRTVPIDRPPDAPTDFAGGAPAAAELGMGRLSKRLEELAQAG